MIIELKKELMSNYFKTISKQSGQFLVLLLPVRTYQFNNVHCIAFPLPVAFDGQYSLTLKMSKPF